MKSIPTLFLFLFSISVFTTYGQDTFSIVAADSTTREVGSAGGSCVDLFAAGFSDATFIGDLLPDTGAINTQASYLASNQKNARARMRAGDTPAQMITWLTHNDVEDNPGIRQYGIAAFSGSNVLSSGYTGKQCIDYKNHRTGTFNGISYSIQGNILIGHEVIDSMESRFRNAEGDLACRLMAAMQGAKRIGADTRCASDGTSTLFAYVKVAQPTDTYGSPSFRVSVRTHDNSHIEPVDSLQTLFDAQHSCVISAIDEAVNKETLKLYPNPAENEIILIVHLSDIGKSYVITDPSGKHVMNGKVTSEKTRIDVHRLIAGVYFIQLGKSDIERFIKN
jgi:uncharacterized Ntn-hydrolase superfamily protein